MRAALEIEDLPDAESKWRHKNKRQHERGKTKGQSRPTNEVLVPSAKHKQNKRANDWYCGQKCDPGKGDHSFAPQRRNMTSAMSAQPITRHITLNLATLKQRQDLAAARNSLATLIKAGVHDGCVKKVVQPCNNEHEIRDGLHRAIPDPSIEPVADPGPPRVQANQRRAIECIDEKSVSEERKGLWLKLPDCVGRFSGLNRLATIEPPTQTKCRQRPATTR